MNNHHARTVATAGAGYLGMTAPGSTTGRPLGAAALNVPEKHWQETHRRVNMTTTAVPPAGGGNPGQGPEDRRARAVLHGRDGSGVHRPGLQPGRHAGGRRGTGGFPLRAGRDRRVHPMLLTSIGYSELNKVDPDCGTTFTWATRTFGPKTGWAGSPGEGGAAARVDLIKFGYSQ